MPRTYETAELPNRIERAVSIDVEAGGAPEHLTKRQVDIWIRTAEVYPTLPIEEPALLESYAIITALVTELSIEIARDGVRTTNAAGKACANPCLNPLRAYLSEKRKLEAEIKKRHQPAREEEDLFA